MKQRCPLCEAGVPHTVCNWMFTWLRTLADWVLLAAVLLLAVAAFVATGWPVQ